MSIKQEIDGQLFIALNGRLGRPNGVGLIKPGWSKLGEWFESAGIYRRDGRWHKQRIVKMVHYKPTNNRLSAQQFWRDYFRNSVAIYHALASNILQLYKQRAKKYGMTGYNYYISEYSNVKPSHVGNYRPGFTKLGKIMWLG